MARLIEVTAPQPGGATLPAARVEDFLARYPLPSRIGAGWHTLDPHYAKSLLSLLYDASAETEALKQVFGAHILPGLARRDHALDIGSGKGRMLDLFRDFQQVTLVERDAASLEDLRLAVREHALPAVILEQDYHEVVGRTRACDLNTFTHSIYYFHEAWGDVAKTAFAALHPGGSLVFTLNGDEGAAAGMVSDLSSLGVKGLKTLDITGFVEDCAHIAGARVNLYRIPCGIHAQNHPDFMLHMARIFLEDLCVPISTELVRDYLINRGNQLDFVDKIIEIKRL